MFGRPEIITSISKQKWDKVKIHLENPSEKTKSLLSGSIRYGFSRHPSLLSFACRYDPPPDVVKMLYEFNPRSTTNVDKCGRAPLHIAARASTYPEVIAYLLEHSYDCAVSQDKYGNTALHLACYGLTKKRDESKKRRETSLPKGANKLPTRRKALVLFHVNDYNETEKSDRYLEDIINILLRKARCAVLEEDYDGLSPLEIAILHELSFRTIRMLQAASIDEMVHNPEAKQKLLQKEKIPRFPSASSFAQSDGGDYWF